MIIYNCFDVVLMHARKDLYSHWLLIELDQPKVDYLRLSFENHVLSSNI